MSQPELFDDEPVTGGDHDPYAAAREAACALSAEFAVSPDEAFDLVLGFGSLTAARRALQQRWWRGEIEVKGPAPHVG